MEVYSADVEAKMRRLYGWLSEKDRRRYAAVEAAKLGHGGVDYVVRLLSCDPKTIRQGMKDLDEPEDPAAKRVRKKGWTPTAGSGEAGTGSGKREAKRTGSDIAESGKRDRSDIAKSGDFSACPYCQ